MRFVLVLIRWTVSYASFSFVVWTVYFIISNKDSYVIWNWHEASGNPIIFFLLYAAAMSVLGIIPSAICLSVSGEISTRGGEVVLFGFFCVLGMLGQFLALMYWNYDQLALSIVMNVLFFVLMCRFENRKKRILENRSSGSA